MMEAETGVLQQQSGNDRLLENHRELGRDKEGFLQTEDGPTDTLDFELEPSLGQYIFVALI